ncbi:hypothetical protein QQF64_011918 [Cirrhinus molitorella]|uniref:Uncharacterized protein n=1 Tax=Cirrhinus molitorella TaxID=172907 RepID=A0ABR3LTZ1_9TELE
MAFGHIIPQLRLEEASEDSLLKNTLRPFAHLQKHSSSPGKSRNQHRQMSFWLKFVVDMVFQNQTVQPKPGRMATGWTTTILSPSVAVS